METAAKVATPENLQSAQTYIDFVKTNLEPLAQQLKVSVEWLWGILVQQARVEAIVLLVVCVGLMITTASLSLVVFKSLKGAKWSSYGEADNKEAFVFIVSGILAVIMTLVSAFTIPSSLTTIVTGLINPEFRAMEKIVEFAKPAADKVTTEAKQ